MVDRGALVTGVGATTAVFMILTMAASAGTMFRLEIGPPVAVGTDFKLKGSVLAVRAVVCDDVAAARVTGTAEGIVNGERQSLALRLLPTRTPGVYAVSQQWPVPGYWVLHLMGECPSPKAMASTIVPIQKNGFIRAKTQVLREPATPAQVEAALADLVRTQP